MYRVITKQPANRTDGSPRNSWDGLALVALVALVACACPGTQRNDAPAPVIVSEPASPYVPPAGAVLTVMTRIVDNAPAGLLDRAASVRLRLHLDTGETYEWSTPIGGEGIWFLDGAQGEGRLEVDVLGPENQRVAFNSARTSELQGLVGTLLFEFASALPEGEFLRCTECSSPERLSDIRGFDHAGLFWRSGGSHITEDAEAITIQFRQAREIEVVTEIIETSGGVLLGPFPVPRNQSVYSVRPVRGSTIDFAKRLSIIPGLIGVELP